AIEVHAPRFPFRGEAIDENSPIELAPDKTISNLSEEHHPGRFRRRIETPRDAGRVKLSRSSENIQDVELVHGLRQEMTSRRHGEVDGQGWPLFGLSGGAAETRPVPRRTFEPSETLITAPSTR